MSVSDVAARIQQLQGQFALLTGVNAPRAAVPTVTSPTAFADALSTATAPGTATGAGPASAGVRTGSTRGTGAMPWTGPLAPAADTSTSRPVAGSTGQAVVDEARKYLGVPYVWGGTDPKRGLDCSGLVQLVYKNFGVELPRVSYMQAREGKAVPSLAQARPGDLLAFGSPSVNHIAMRRSVSSNIVMPNAPSSCRAARPHRALLGGPGSRSGAGSLRCPRGCPARRRSPGRTGRRRDAGSGSPGDRA